MTDEQIKITFEHINEYWLEKGYKQCKKEWEEVLSVISEEKTDTQCINCDTYWKIPAMVNNIDNICPMCDTWCQPFLYNPLNRDSVLKYIHQSYHKYLFPIDLDSDPNSYIICRHTKGNVADTNIVSFVSIKNLYKYITNYLDFVVPDDFLASYNDYLAGKHVKNGHGMLFSKDYVDSFGNENMQYEIYRIDKNSKYAVVIFVNELNLIGSAKGYETNEEASEYMSEEYKRIYDDDVPKKDFIFGMIFDCNY
jgi:hypothetical protein